MKVRLLFTVILIFIAGKLAFAITGKPNIIMFNVEDSSAKRYGAYGGQAITPNIDKLASEGVTFENGMVNGAVCNPSRASWLTGLRPTTTKVYGNADDWHMAVDMVEVTMPQHLRNNGYETARAGKMYHALYTDGKHPGSFDLELSEKRDDIPYVGAAAPNGESNIKWGSVDAPAEHLTDGHMTLSVVEYLGESHAKPFFIAIGYHSPHLTFSAPKQFFDIYDRDSINLPEPTEEYTGQDNGDLPATTEGWKDIYIAHLACISYVDWGVGKVLQALKDNGLEENTIVVFTSDHGFMLGEHWLFRKGQNSHWDETDRVPYIWKVPGITPPNTRSTAMVEMIDSYPTFFDLAGIPMPDQTLEGKSIRRVLENPDERFKKAAFTEGSVLIAIQTERYRMVVTNPDMNVEKLYDHENDPGEINNLADDPDYADVIAELLSYESNEVWPENQTNVPAAYVRPKANSKVEFYDVKGTKQKAYQGKIPGMYVPVGRNKVDGK